MRSVDVMNSTGHPGEFLSGFHKTDRLIPVITFVVYYGSVPWDAAMDLHGLPEDAILNMLERIFKLTAQDARKYLTET